MLTSELFCVFASFVAMRYWIGASRTMMEAPTNALQPNKQQRRIIPITICRETKTLRHRKITPWITHGQKHINFCSAHLDRHCPQIGAQEEEPHQLIGLYSHQVVDLPQSHLPHRHVGGGQTQDFVVNHCLVNEADMKREPLHFSPCLNMIQHCSMRVLI